LEKPIIELKIEEGLDTEKREDSTENGEVQL
jgi:hypothetical protein